MKSKPYKLFGRLRAGRFTRIRGIGLKFIEILYEEPLTTKPRQGIYYAHQREMKKESDLEPQNDTDKHNFFGQLVAPHVLKVLHQGNSTKAKPDNCPENRKME